VKNIELIAGVAYVAFWVGIATISIGQPPHMTAEVSWYFPFTIAFVIGFPLVLGYMAGRKSHDH